MRWLIPALFLACGFQAVAGEVTCSAGGVTIIDTSSCTLGSVASMLVNNPPNLDENVFAVARAGQTNADPSGAASSGSASYDDSFAIPASPAFDVFKIAVLIQTDSELNSSSGPLFSQVQIGSDAIGSPALDYNSLDDPGNCQRRGCAFLFVAPASAFNMVQLSGNESLETADSASGGFAFSFASVSVTRYASDGVTPDPFTPEPATAGLAGAAVVLLLARAYLKRRRRTVAYS